MASDVLRLKNFFTSAKTVFFDCDGVLWNSFGLIDGSVDLVKKFKEKGMKVFFITNNSSKSTADCLKKFQKFDFDVSSEQIFSTSYLAAVYFKNIMKLNSKQKVYVIGSPAMAEEFDKAGIHHIGIGPLPVESPDSTDVARRYNLEKDPEVAAVCVGFDGHFNLHKVAQAMQYLKDPEIPFIATNLDNSLPMGNGLFAPGTGCIISSVSTACGREPLVLGKPSTLFLDVVKTISGVEPETTLMIGDRMDTDISFGINCGFQTALVLTGITSLNDLNNYPNVRPNYVLNSVKDMLAALEGT